MEKAKTYTIHIAGLTRELPLCKVTDDIYIAAFICFGDAELTEACAREMLKLVPREDYDYILTAESISWHARASRITCLTRYRLMTNQ